MKQLLVLLMVVAVVGCGSTSKRKSLPKPGDAPSGLPPMPPLPGANK